MRFRFHTTKSGRSIEKVTIEFDSKELKKLFPDGFNAKTHYYVSVEGLWYQEFEMRGIQCNAKDVVEKRKKIIHDGGAGLFEIDTNNVPSIIIPASDFQATDLTSCTVEVKTTFYNDYLCVDTQTAAVI